MEQTVVSGLITTAFIMLLVILLAMWRVTLCLRTKISNWAQKATESIPTYTSSVDNPVFGKDDVPPVRRFPTAYWSLSRATSKTKLVSAVVPLSEDLAPSPEPHHAEEEHNV
ncbi:hypothetical protein MPTK1_8g02050 [Marchantia polymorpha subsp. ruderalis]|uniref:Uncharacterized protein n=1 Tax=Marchantia polymorpha TaxID=3197 RepID=A0A2R6XIW1_MARPO|nr:hypothetical protein MARPO_0012s0004 [Marchantia polymorpha]BBN18372.1 hypothetical protein Mp_8g02050 [Marchantia polymorpha subsp. ruderalis]|eukprot:PTQ46021.1 hypothetical protein MARPO_0012s0004 [Marchantia polymorpha]